jgi:hypothetical protein
MLLLLNKITLKMYIFGNNTVSTAHSMTPHGRPSNRICKQVVTGHSPVWGTIKEPQCRTWWKSQPSVKIARVQIKISRPSEYRTSSNWGLESTGLHQTGALKTQNCIILGSSKHRTPPNWGLLGTELYLMRLPEHRTPSNWGLPSTGLHQTGAVQAQDPI